MLTDELLTFYATKMMLQKSIWHRKHWHSSKEIDAYAFYEAGKVASNILLRAVNSLINNDI